MEMNFSFLQGERGFYLQRKAEVNPVRNSSGALDPAGIILKCNPAAEQGGIISNGVKRSQSQSYMEENLERCVKCGKQQGLQSVAVTIWRRTFHLFYLCAECGNVDIEELLMIIRLYKEKRKT